MAGVHEDFGEKIGGAKKDLWKDRGLYADDLEAMNEREAEKFVKKDNVWKKPDYAAMLEEGMTPEQILEHILGWRKGFLLAWSILSKKQGTA